MRNFARIFLPLAAAMGLLYVGCGVKNKPEPPSMVRPQRITDLQAASVDNGIRIRWGRPEHYTSGKRMRDLGKFEILRAAGGAEPTLLADIPVTDQQRFRQQRHFTYLDTDTKIGQRYRYQIIAVTTDGYESLPSNQAEAVRAVPTPTPNPENFVLPTPVPLPR